MMNELVSLLDIDFCDKSGVLYVIMIIKYFIAVVKILAPIIIIVTASMALGKAVGNPDELKKLAPIFAKKLIAALAIFLVPTLVNYAMDSLANRDPNSFAACSAHANSDYIRDLKAREEEERKIRLAAKEKEAADAAAKANEKLSGDNDSTNGNEVYNKRKEERKNRNQNNNGNGSGNGDSGSGDSGSLGSTDSSVPAGTANIIIGDSRTVGMCGTMGGSNCPFSSGGGASVGNDFYICQSAMGYSWFESTAVPAVNSILSKNPNTRYNIISLMGVNFLLYDIDKYIVKYNELAKGAWSNQNIILVSVNPVNEQVEASHGYSTKNANIETFNAKLKQGTSGVSNIGYCDVYGQIKGNFGTGDGLHYDGETNKKIYNLMMSCV